MYVANDCVRCAANQRCSIPKAMRQIVGRQNLHDRLGLFHSCLLGTPALLSAVNRGAHPFVLSGRIDQVSWPPPFNFRGRQRSGFWPPLFRIPWPPTYRQHSACSLAFKPATDCMEMTRAVAQQILAELLEWK